MPHGTTTATNAVLERRIARTVFVTTDGFADVLEIGRQDRPALYDLSVTRPEPLVPRDRVVTVVERMGSDGKPVIELTEEEIERVVEQVGTLEPESVAVSLLFAYAGSQHERRLCEALERLRVPVTRSSDLLAEFREFERGSTCVLNAAVEPVMRRDLSNLSQRLPDPTITVMTSSGGTAGIAYAAAAPVHTLLSGPAAGVVAAGAVARSAGFDDAIAFDMGGTSTDVCLIRGGAPEVSTSSRRSRACRSARRRSGSIRWERAEGRSPGSTRVGHCGSGPGQRAPTPGRPATAGAGRNRPSLTRIAYSVQNLDPDRELGGGLRLDVDAARRVLDALPLVGWRGARRARCRPRDDGPRAAQGEHRAGHRSVPTGAGRLRAPAPVRCTPRHWPGSSAARRSSCHPRRECSARSACCSPHPGSRRPGRCWPTPVPTCRGPGRS